MRVAPTGAEEEPTMDLRKLPLGIDVADPEVRDFRPWISPNFTIKATGWRTEDGIWTVLNQYNLEFYMILVDECIKIDWVLNIDL